ncbi:hypothetical protein YPPY05_3807, partial [Yersinia pestis PY-05]
MASNGPRDCQPNQPSPWRVDTLCRSNCFRRRFA